MTTSTPASDLTFTRPVDGGMLTADVHADVWTLHRISWGRATVITLLAWMPVEDAAPEVVARLVEEGSRTAAAPHAGRAGRARTASLMM